MSTLGVLTVYSGYLKVCFLFSLWENTQHTWPEGKWVHTTTAREHNRKRADHVLRPGLQKTFYLFLWELKFRFFLVQFRSKRVAQKTNCFRANKFCCTAHRRKERKEKTLRCLCDGVLGCNRAYADWNKMQLTRIIRLPSSKCEQGKLWYRRCPKTP